MNLQAGQKLMFSIAGFVLCIVVVGVGNPERGAVEKVAKSLKAIELGNIEQRAHDVLVTTLGVSTVFSLLIMALVFAFWFREIIVPPGTPMPLLFPIETVAWWSLPYWIVLCIVCRMTHWNILAGFGF